MHAILIITVFAGTGDRGYSGDGGMPQNAKLNSPFDVTFDIFGQATFSDTFNHSIRQVSVIGYGKSGTLNTIAGNGTKGYSGDGGPAIKATLNEPYAIEFDSENNLFIVDRLNYCIRRVDGKTGVITTVAGTGKSGTSQDGIAATKADLAEPNGMCIDRSGNLFIADVRAHKVRVVNLKTGIISTLLGTGEKKTTDGPLVKATTFGPRALCFMPDGRLLLVEREGNCVRMIDLEKKTITRIAGTGQKGYSGDGGKAIDASFNGPKELDVDKRGNIYVVDTENDVIRQIDSKTGVIQTIAGRGRTKTPGLGDGGDPLKATLGRPHGVAIGPDDAIYIGDTLSHRIRVVKPKQ